MIGSCRLLAFDWRRTTLSDQQRSAIYDAIAALDWSRKNKEWVTEAKLGVWDTPKGSEEPQVVVLGAGRNNTQAIIDYLRKLTGLQTKLDELKADAISASELVAA